MPTPNNRPRSAIAENYDRNAAELAEMQKVLENPLGILPPSWKPSVFHFWMFFSNLIKDELVTLCIRLNEYAKMGMTFQELQRIFAACKKYDFENGLDKQGLYKRLSAGVGANLRIKQNTEAQLRARNEQAELSASIVGSLAERFRSH